MSADPRTDPPTPDPLTADNATERERLAYGRGLNKKAIDGSHVTGGDASLMAGGVSRSTAADAGAQTPPPAALPSAPDQRLREARDGLVGKIDFLLDGPEHAVLRAAVTRKIDETFAALSEATTSPEPLDWHARRKPDDPFPEPTRPEVEQMLRRRLDPMMVYALRPAGDPFADWAKAIIGEATTSPEATLDVCPDCGLTATRIGEIHINAQVAARLRGPA